MHVNSTNASGAPLTGAHNVAELSDLNLARFGERVALTGGDRTFTNRQMHDASRRLASALLARGLRADDRVGVYLENCVELLWTYHAISAIGATVVPLLAASRATEVHTRLSHCGARALVAGERAAETLDRRAMPSVEQLLLAEDLQAMLDMHEPLAEVAPRARDQLAFILYTGGTAEVAKGVMQTHGNLLANVRNNASLNVARTDLIVLPLAHTFCLGVWLSNYWMGGRGVLMRGSFEARRVLRLIEQHRIERLVAVPSMLAALLEHPAADHADMSSMKEWAIGGAPMGASQLARFRDKFPGQVLPAYGLTEACPTVARGVAGQTYKPGSSGRVVPGVVVRIVDPQSGGALPVGETGEICVSGDNVSPGYLDMPEQTARTFRDGWLHSGDLGRLDDDGELFVVGRIKDLIIQGGLNVYPSEVESVLAGLEGVGQAAVVGLPDDLVGEIVVAFVTTALGAAQPDEAKLRAYCAERLAPYKVPARVHTVDELPLTDLGKIDKQRLRTRARALANAAPDHTAGAAPLLARLCRAFADVLERDSVGPDDNFFELGGTSLQVTRVVGVLRGELQAPLQLRTFFEGPSPSQLAERLGEAVGDREGQPRPTAAPPEPLVPAGDARFAHSGLDDGQLAIVSEQLGPLEDVELIHRLSAGQLDAVGQIIDEHRHVSSDALRDSLMSMHLVIEGEIDLEAWREAWQRVVDAHPALRSIIVWGDLPHPVQVVMRRVEISIREIDAKDMPPGEQRRAYSKPPDRCRPLRAPWLDLQLARIGEQTHAHTCEYHMALIDGFTLRELRLDLFSEYANTLAGRPARIRPRAPFVDYISWLYRQDRGAAERFWRARGVGVSVANPTKRPRAGDYMCVYPAAGEALLDEHARRLQVPAALLLLGAWAICYGDLAHADEVVVALMDSGRNAPVGGIDEMVGSFSHRLPLRVPLQHKGMPLRRWLRQIQLQIADAQTHEHALTQPRLQKWWGVAPGCMPFDIGMNIQYMLPLETDRAEDLPANIRWFFTNNSRWPAAPVNLSVWFSGIGININVAYDRERFSSAQIEALAERFLATVEAIVDDTDDVLQDVIDKIDG